MYAELHCHSAFSFLDGASLPEDLAATAHELGYSALALTDHNGLYGSMTFAQSAKPLGLQAITGAEVTLLGGDSAHLTLLAETPQGYANLCRLLTEAHLGRADRREARHLQDVEQGRFIEERLSVVHGDEPVVRREHFPRRFGVGSLVRIPEARVTEPPSKDDPADHGPSGDREEKAGEAPSGRLHAR